MWLLLPLLTFCILPVDSLKIESGWRHQQIVVSSDSLVTLDDVWLIGNSVRLVNKQGTLPETKWFWNDSLQIFHATPRGCSVGDTLVAIWRSAAITERSSYFYFQPAKPDTIQTTAPKNSPTITTSRSQNPLDAWPGIRRSGTIVRGVKFGSGNESGTTSGLHLEVSGRPTPGVEVEAVVDDRSLGGATGSSSTTLAELDQLYMTASTKHLNGTLGDWDLSWSGGEYGTIRRRLKGGKFSIFNEKNRFEAVAAGGNSRFSSIVINGRGGDQGPYELLNRFGKSGVSILAGSEKVALDGRKLTRGENADYTIDYYRGTITFAPSVPILNNSNIDIEYEYSDDSYPKRFIAVKGDASGRLGLSRWNTEFTVAEEGVNGDNPLAFEWTPESRAAVVAAGDNLTTAIIPGITAVEVGQGDYIWGETSAGDSILVFSTPDSIGHPTGYLKVEFSTMLGGEYQRVYDSNYLLFKYYWVGHGAGTYTPSNSIPLPDRTRIGISKSNWLGGGFSSFLEVALSEYDKNTLSSLQDNDNRGIGINWQGAWSKSDSSIASNLKIKHKQKSFRTLSREDPLDFYHHWAIVDSNQPSEETSVETSLAIQPTKSIRISSDFGQIERKNDLLGNRIGVGASIIRNALNANFTFDHLNSTRDILSENTVTDRFSTAVEGDPGIVKPRLTIRYENQATDVTDTLRSGYRIYQTNPGFLIDLSNWGKVDCDYMYRQEDAPIAGKLVKSIDSRSAKFGWYGVSKFAQWRSTFLRSLQTFTDPSLAPLISTSAALATVIGNYRTPFRFIGDYRLSTGTGRSDVWVASFVGDGEGSYRYEDGHYVPDEDGNIDLQSRQSDQTRFASKVEFNGRFEWRANNHSSGESLQPYPFGISGTNTFFDAAVVTTEPDPLGAFILSRSAFRSTFVDRSRWNWRQEIEFLDQAYSGDGRLTVRRDESRDAGLSGGEESLLESGQLRIRFRSSSRLSFQLLPLLERQRRYDLNTSKMRSNVESAGGDVQIDLSSESHRWETSLKLGKETRHELLKTTSVNETRLQPTLLRRFGEKGSGRIEGEWRLLKTSSSYTNYDLLRGWYRGNNYSLNFNFDYRIGTNVTATASLRSRWRPAHSPILSGLFEMTATL